MIQSTVVTAMTLLKVAHEILGDNVMAITVQSGSFPKRELNEAIAFCKKEGIRHKVCQVDEMKIEGFSQNPPNRCYLCKHALFEKIGAIAEKNKIAYVAEGSNMDDLGDYRPVTKLPPAMNMASAAETSVMMIFAMMDFVRWISLILRQSYFL